MSMFIQLICLSLLVTIGVNGDCTLPPTLWCDSVATARECGVESQCKQWKSTPAATMYNLTLLYETHCPYSQEYFVNYFYPFVVQRLQSFNIVTVNMVPWGNAKRQADGSIVCQHGQKECDGNRLTSCVQHYVADSAQQLSFSFCLLKNLMQKVELYAAKRACFETSKFDANMQQKIKTCYNGPLGDQLQRLAERATSHARPTPPAGVPWLIVNGRSLETVQTVSRDMHNLLPFWVHQGDPNKSPFVEMTLSSGSIGSPASVDKCQPDDTEAEMAEQVDRLTIEMPPVSQHRKHQTVVNQRMIGSTQVVVVGRKTPNSSNTRLDVQQVLAPQKHAAAQTHAANRNPAIVETTSTTRTPIAATTPASIRPPSLYETSTATEAATSATVAESSTAFERGDTTEAPPDQQRRDKAARWRERAAAQARQIEARRQQMLLRSNGGVKPTRIADILSEPQPGTAEFSADQTYNQDILLTHVDARLSNV